MASFAIGWSIRLTADLVRRLVDNESAREQLCLDISDDTADAHAPSDASISESASAPRFEDDSASIDPTQLRELQYTHDAADTNISQSASPTGLGDVLAPPDPTHMSQTQPAKDLSDVHHTTATSNSESACALLLGDDLTSLTLNPQSQHESATIMEEETCFSEEWNVPSIVHRAQSFSYGEVLPLAPASYSKQNDKPSESYLVPKSPSCGATNHGSSSSSTKDPPKSSDLLKSSSSKTSTRSLSETSVQENWSRPPSPNSSHTSKDAQVSAWNIVGGFIEHEGKVVGCTDSWLEYRLEELREENEDVIDVLKEKHDEELEIFARNAWNDRLQLQRKNSLLKSSLDESNEALAEQKNMTDAQIRAIEERDEIISHREGMIETQRELLFQRDRDMAEMRLEMDALRDQVALQAPSGPTHPQDMERIAAQHRAVQRMSFIFFDYNAEQLNTINDLQGQVQVQTNLKAEAENMVSELRKEIQRAPWRNQELVLFNAEQKNRLDQADMREARLGKRINRAEDRIRQMRSNIKNLEQQRMHSIASEEGSAEVLAALERFHVFCHRNMLNIAEINDNEAIKKMIAFEDEFVAAACAMFHEQEELKNTNQTLVEAGEMSLEKIRVLTNENQSLKAENQALSRANTQKEVELFDEQMISYGLQEKVNELQLDASLTPELKKLVLKLRNQLIHDWIQAAPVDWRNSIIQISDDLNTAEGQRNSLRQQLEDLQKKYEPLKALQKDFENEMRAASNIYGRFAMAWNKWVDSENLCNELRRRLGEPQVSFMFGGENKLPALYKLDDGQTELHQLMLEPDGDGKYNTPDDFEGLEEGNDLLVWGGLEKDEDGLYRKGENSWWLGNGDALVPVGPTTEHYEPTIF